MMDSPAATFDADELLGTTTQFPAQVDALRVATYNIHKGVQGIGPLKRLEVHNLALAVEQLDADIVCLQEVRSIYRPGSRKFVHWPSLPQSEYLKPLGYQSVYRTNAFTSKGEHGNALLSRWPIVDCRHEDVSDHFLEQRGFLHVTLDVMNLPMHVLVIHLGLVPGSRVRQIERIKHYMRNHIPVDERLVIAGDFNEWSPHIRETMKQNRLLEYSPVPPVATYPSVLPVVQFDHIFARGMEPQSLYTPHGRIWRRMSDHLPLIAEFKL